MQTERTTALQERLEEFLVFELFQEDNATNYLRLNARALYRHVLAAIASRGGGNTDTVEDTPATRRGTRQPSIDLPMLPLGAALGDDAPDLQDPSNLPTPLSKPRNRRAATIGSSSPPSNKTTTDTPAEPTYRERLGGYLHPRDMRRLVTPFSASNEPELIVRRHVMLLNFDPLRAIVLRDRLLVLVPDGADSMLVNLEERVRGGRLQFEDSIFGSETKSDSQRQVAALEGILEKQPSEVKTTTEVSTQPELPSDSSSSSEFDEWEEMEGTEWVNLPFELQCVDACLHIVCGLLTEDTNEVQDATLNYIGQVLRDPTISDDPLTIIRAIKDAVKEMSSRVKGFVQSMNRVLNEDEDMALMNLSRLLTHPERFIQPVAAEILEEESDEPELILEAHLQIGLTLMNSLELIQGQIETASELVDQKLDSVRNKLLFANMMISVFSLCAACVSIVGSFMGMNLYNGLEDDPNAFVQVCFGSLAGGIVLGGFIMLSLIRSGAIPGTGTFFKL